MTHDPLQAEIDLFRHLLGDNPPDLVAIEDCFSRLILLLLRERARGDNFKAAFDTTCQQFDRLAAANQKTLELNNDLMRQVIDCREANRVLLRAVTGTGNAGIGWRRGGAVARCREVG